MSVRLFIDGAHGTTGLEIRDRLSGRSGIELITLDDSQRKDAGARRDALNSADIAILCLPDDAAKEAVAMIEGNARFIDASSAHRISPNWTYGFPELSAGQRDAIQAAQFVSNPGCYPTGFLALVAPLVGVGLISKSWPFTVNAVSGYSGGGKALIERYEVDAPLAHRAYGLTLDHKHAPEMGFHAGLEYLPIFSPMVTHAHRGMLVDVPLALSAMPNLPSVDALIETLQAHYAASRIVSVIDGRGGARELLLRSDDAPTDRLDLYVFANEAGDQVRLMAYLDNLGKGASGAAVQNFNLMTGADEYEGLRF